MTDKRKLIGCALAELVEQARSGGPKIRIALMAAGSEFGGEELLKGAELAMAQNSSIQVVPVGPRVLKYDKLEWIDTPDCEGDIAAAMESALKDGRVDAAVALHYPFPLGVTTIGRVLTPARGKPLLIASCTGASATNRTEAMLRNTIYGIAVAKSLGINKPSVGILNLEAAGTVQKALNHMKQRGYAIEFGASLRGDGGALLRGNDLLAGAVDVCVCDTLTGNVLVKIFSAFNTGGGYESLGWGYGPSVGDSWRHIITIISRASGAPVIGNALCYTAALVRGNLAKHVAEELAAAKKAELESVVASFATKATNTRESQSVRMPPVVPVDSEIHGLDVLTIEAAVMELWKSGVYAESAMGCTGPVVKVPAQALDRSAEVLRLGGFL
jgi:betaine reductase